MRNTTDNLLNMQSILEQDFMFLGATAVEDTLQWKAAETIDRLRQSGFKMWICTGDKLETTLSVAKACKLYTKDSENVLCITNS